MSTQNGPSRQPKGTPVGGQFAASAHAEANVDLSANMDDEASAADYMAFVERSAPGPDEAHRGDCQRCGAAMIDDPSGSRGVLVHADEDGQPDYDADEDHAPVPDDAVPVLGLTGLVDADHTSEQAEANATRIMDAENARNGAWEPGQVLSGDQSETDDLDAAAGAATEAARMLAHITDDEMEPLTPQRAYEANRRAAEEALASADPWGLSMAAVCLESNLAEVDDPEARAAASALSAARRQDPVDAPALADAMREAIAVGDRQIRTFDGRTAAQWRAEAAASRRRSFESFERSDTDGFLSQWASDQMASKYGLCATIAEQGGRLSHPALFDLDGNPVAAKLIETRYGQAWMLLDEEGRSTGEFVNPSKANTGTKRAIALAKKGYRTGRVMAPMALNHSSGDAYRADGGYSPDNEVLYVIGADGSNPRRDQVEAEGGEFNEWYD